MKSWSTQNTVEAIGIIGVIGSLIFVGGELRQNAIATRAAMNADIAVAFVDVNLVVASSPELTKRVAEYADNPAAAPRDAQIQMLAIWRAVFHVWSNVHRQHLNGTIDPAIFDSVVQEISTYAGVTPDNNQNADIARRQVFVLWAWESERFIYNPDFQEFIDGILGISR